MQTWLIKHNGKTLIEENDAGRVTGLRFFISFLFCLKSTLVFCFSAISLRFKHSWEHMGRDQQLRQVKQIYQDIHPRQYFTCWDAITGFHAGMN